MDFTFALIFICLFLLIVIYQSKLWRDELRQQLYQVKAEKENLKRAFEIEKEHLKRTFETEKENFERNFNEALNQKILEKVSSIRHRSHYSSIPIFGEFTVIPMHNKRFMNSIKENMRIRNFEASAFITSESQNTYHTTLTSCECKDFQVHHQPCKHMYRLALELGLMIDASTEEVTLELYNLYEKIEEIAADAKFLETEKRKLNQEIYNSMRIFEEKKAAEIKRIEEEKKALLDFRNSTEQTFPHLAMIFSDYYYLKDMELSHHLRYKSPPAIKAAENVKALANEKRELLQKLKLAEYQLNFYENLFPWLLDFKEVSPQEAISILAAQTESQNQDESEYSYFQNYLSPVEYARLSHTQKLQRALDRYQSRKKTNWDVGIEYERYVGYLYEKDGYTVTYAGALEGFKDMGRDLIVKSKDGIEIIQCKRWAQEKIIHEKHIFQLYGSIVLYQIQNPKKKVSGVFYTTTTLSETAKECAAHLGIKYFETFAYQDHPLIKCNISKNGERIYHLPFDQQYDNTFITPEKGDFYASTVLEAEEHGFRHAYKWNPENLNSQN